MGGPLLAVNNFNGVKLKVKLTIDQCQGSLTRHPSFFSWTQKWSAEVDALDLWMDERWIISKPLSRPYVALKTEINMITNMLPWVEPQMQLR